MVNTIELDAFKVAKQLYGNQDYGACELILSEHLKVNRADVDAYSLMAENYEKIFRPDLAVKSYQSAVEIAKAKGDDFQTLEESAARVEATLEGIRKGGQSVAEYKKSNEENINPVDEGGADRSAFEKLGRRISPYFGFPESNHRRLTSNSYGFIIADGFKGMEVPYTPEPRSNEFIVGIFGGSIACAFYQDAVAQLTEGLSNHPDLAGRPVTVLNYSMSGSKQPETMIMLAYFTTIGQNFDLIINMDGMNDLAGCAGNLHQGHHIAMPPADITNIFMALTAIPDLDVNSLKYFLRLGQYDKCIKFVKESALPIPGRMALAEFLGKKRKRLVNQKPKVNADENLINIQRVKPDSMLGMNEEDFTDRVLQIRKFWFNCVENMVQICRGRGIKYVHTLHPSHFILERDLGENDAQLVKSLSSIGWYQRIVGAGFPLMNEKLQTLSSLWGEAYHCNLQPVLEELGDDMLLDPMGHFKQPVNLAMAGGLTNFINSKSLI